MKNLDFGEIFQISAKNSRFWGKFSSSRRKNPNFDDNSIRSDEILIEFGEISSNLVRFLPNLAKSYRVRWDFIVFEFFSPFSRCFLVVSHHFLRSMMSIDSSTTRWRSNPPDSSTLAIGDGWDFLPPDSVGSVLGWV